MVERKTARRLRGMRAAIASDRSHDLLPTRCAAAQLFWSDAPIPRQPLVYEPGVVVVVSGRQIGHLDDRRFVLEEGGYLAVGLPICFDCETEASPSNPLIGLYLRAEPETLRELASGLAESSRATPPRHTSLGVEPLPLSPAMRMGLARLTEQLADETESRLLAPATIREIFFRALEDSDGRAFLAQTRPDRPEARIAALLRKLDDDPERAPSVEALSAAVGMSPASFHRHFKAAFGAPPLQFLKRRRLHRARALLGLAGASVADAARATGYANASHFSRDFRALFGASPRAARAHALG